MSDSKGVAPVYLVAAAFVRRGILHRWTGVGEDPGDVRTVHDS